MRATRVRPFFARGCVRREVPGARVTVSGWNRRPDVATPSTGHRARRRCHDLGVRNSAALAGADYGVVVVLAIDRRLSADAEPLDCVLVSSGASLVSRR